MVFLEVLWNGVLFNLGNIENFIFYLIYFFFFCKFCMLIWSFGEMRFCLILLVKMNSLLCVLLRFCYG
jgi:hypothetical protein